MRRPAYRGLIAALICVALMLAGLGSPPALAAIGPADVVTTIARAHLAEPLVRTSPTTAAEDQALAQAVAGYEHRGRPDDLSSLTTFIAQHPRSGWTTALLTNLGLSYLHDGYFSQAIATWKAAWEGGRNAKDPAAAAIVDRAVGELARLYASLGQFQNLAQLFEEIGKRPISGSATEAVQAAREALTLSKTNPIHLYNCGPVGLRLLMLALDPKGKAGDFLPWVRVSPKGASLAELAGLATKAKFSSRLVSRKPGQPVPFPSLVHWKVGHYSAIIGQANGHYQLADPIFPGSSHWVTQAALDAEASGYFLVPANTPVNPAWRTVATKEAASVWGKGPTFGTQAGGAGDPGAHKPPACGMCGYDIKESAVGVTLSDTPVGYAPPIGHAATVTITYNQREDSQPATFNFFNVSQKWTLDWLSYVVDDPTNPGASVSRYLPGGGAYYYSGYSSSTGNFTAQNDDGSILVLTSSSTYRRQLSDGSQEIYAQSDGSTSYPRKLFLSQVIDPQGNSVTLNYDSLMRLTSLTDATGRQTTFSYGLSAKPLLVTQITDPFGRSATLTYDGSGRLSSITDTIGLTSSFTYDANSLVNSMTTPYGTTSFAYTAPGSGGPPRFVQVTDPLGYHEREEWLEPAPIADSDPSGTVPSGMPISLVNEFLSYRDSFYWDKNAYVVAGCTPSGGCDYSKARDTHFNHVDGTSIKSTSVESIRYPLENRIWYVYPGQTNAIYAGVYEKPIATGRVLDDGTTQLTQNTYDTDGYFNLTQTIDPLGRITTFTYSNQIDLAAVSQTTAFGVQTTIAQFTYNTHHQPVLATDAAGQTTSIAYNAAGQPTAVTNPLGQTTSYHYNSTGDLTSITDANGLTSATYTYDALDRRASFTDSEGWTVSYNYDNADRLTQVSYPDGTAETYTYNKLDLVSYQDRLVRTWNYAYDADQRLTATTDPAAHQVLRTYNPAGRLTAQTDPNGALTQWAYDVEERLTTKTYADTSMVTRTYETTTSRLKAVTDALTQTKNYSYAKDDQLLGLTYTGAINPTPSVSFTYDPYFQRVTSRTDGAGTSQFSYVPVGQPGALQVQYETPPLVSGPIVYAYDVLGRRTSVAVPGSGAETFQYDTLGRPSGHGSDLGSFALGYLGETGQITERQLTGSSLATTWSYLANSGDRRLAGVSTTGLSAGQFSSFQYTTNAANEATGSTETSDSAIDYPPNALAQAASYNTLNQLTNFSGATLTYDANGNLTSDAIRTYSWDAENRLVGISYPGQPGKATAFSYDGLGRRITISSTPAGGGTTVTTSYVWCGAEPCQARDASGAVTREYYAEGELVSGSSSQSFYYAPDRTRSMRRAFASAEAPKYDYDPYGNALQSTTPVTDYGYAGLFYNGDSGLYLATYRAYDPVAGRWLARDPMGEAADRVGNLYAYAGDDPVDEVDPAGLVVFRSFSEFKWWGNWGGPGWSNGGWHPESGRIPDPWDPDYVAPKDAEDACYEAHDRCVHGCPSCPTHGNQCLRGCDSMLNQCLDALPKKTFGSRVASFAFATFIPLVFH